MLQIGKFLTQYREFQKYKMVNTLTDDDDDDVLVVVM
jgi:hypothetical protein